MPGPAPGAKPSGADKPPSTSKPVNGNSNASAAAAAAAASTAAGESIFSKWGAAAQKHIAELQVKADVASKEFQKQAKSFKMPKKWEMPGWLCVAQQHMHYQNVVPASHSTQYMSTSMSSAHKWYATICVCTYHHPPIDR